MESKGECAYHGEGWGLMNDGVENVIYWIWREMLLQELASGNEISSMVASIKSLGINSDILKLLGASFIGALVFVNI